MKVEAEKSLARQEEETSTGKLALAQVKPDLEISRCQWEDERSRLPTDHIQKTSKLTFFQELEKKSSEWEEDRSHVLDEQMKETFTLRQY
ncbi:titin-like protein [Lates japonicus]|uniref:Titin-like protein n=1 Tax=Lates japonicus TaxID=270547 RepID=A0AAD3MI79_LATJO|nr:titin-like protein [Lates japonicus]